MRLRMKQQVRVIIWGSALTIGQDGNNVIDLYEKVQFSN